MPIEMFTLATEGGDRATFITSEKAALLKQVEERKKVLGQFTLLQDEHEIPIQPNMLDWRCFNSDYYSNDLSYDEVKDIIAAHTDRMIDVRPYMIETPFVAQSTDRLQKILDIFRNMHLRCMPVINPGSGALEGIITR